MLRLIGEYGIILLPRTDEAEQLAALYIAEEVVPKSEPTDATHIAITAANGLDFIVSLNFEHIIRPWTIERVRRVNMREIHAARRMIQDETKDMLPEEKGAYIHSEAISALAAIGITPRYADFTNHGKLKPRQPVTQ